MPIRNGFVGLAFESLPTLAPEPRLIRGNGHVRSKDNFSIAFDDLDLRSWLVQTEVAPRCRWNGNQSSALDGHEDGIGAHECSIAAKP